MPEVVVVMGVSGCGKSTIGEKLGLELGLPFFDADDFHPQANVKKMSSGKPLDDSDRKPWLEIIGRNIQEWKNSTGAVVACSALKEKYRSILSTAPNIKWVILLIDEESVTARLEKRSNHFMPAALLQSQFDALEVPEYGLKVNATLPLKHLITTIVEYINSND